MLRVVTKEDYWAALDRGLLDDLPQWQTRLRDLKHVQDAMAMSYLAEMSGKQIAEIGGGTSRVLPFLAEANACSNVEPFEGDANGPKNAAHNERIEIIPEYLGQSGSSIADGRFDVVFSVSVVEHISTPDLYPFFSECARILRPGGLMLHLIDVYVKDVVDEGTETRLREYGRCFEHEALSPTGPNDLQGGLTFRTNFATNSDLAMNEWNRIGPALRSMRTESQSCSVVLAASAVG